MRSTRQHKGMQPRPAPGRESGIGDNTVNASHPSTAATREVLLYFRADHLGIAPP